MSLTLKGKDNYLFLINDSVRSLDKHTSNESALLLENVMWRQDVNNLYMLVYPDKEVICEKFLPDGNEIKYRTSLDIYKTVFEDRLLDPTDILDTTDYYKTDSHMNNKGNYKVYNRFIEFLKHKFPEDRIEAVNIELTKVEVPSLVSLELGLGDLTWEHNKKDVVLDDISDIYYEMPKEYNFSSTVYNCNEEDFRILNRELTDMSIESKNKLITWDVVSNSIFYHKSSSPCINKKVVFIYDSFMLPSIGLYRNLFRETYFVKDVFDQKYINKIKPDLIFEFRIERFLF